METLNCPYCNERMYLADVKDNWFESPCCKKDRAVFYFQRAKIALHTVTKKYLIDQQIDGDNSGADTLIRTNTRTTEPRWAHVYSDGMVWYVRICPPCDLQEHGRGHGVALGNQYTTKAEANKFADSMERYFGDAEHDIKTSAQIDIQ